MIRILARKLALYCVALLCVVSINFGLTHLMPGDPLIHLLGEEGHARGGDLSSEAADRLRSELGLDEPVMKQYGRHLVSIVSGDWGYSYHYGNLVVRVIGERLLWTLLLLAPAVLIGTVLGGSLGAWSGWPGKGKGALSSLLLLIYSVPGYCLGILLLVAAARTSFIPLGGMADPSSSLLTAVKHLMLPLTILSVHATAYYFLIMRNTVRLELDSPYVTTALSKGLSRGQTLFRHILKNTLPPYLSAVALNLGFMVGGALLTEVVFSWQGMGTLIRDAVVARDYPILSGTLTALGISVITANLAADICCILADPRIREGGAG